MVPHSKKTAYTWTLDIGHWTLKKGFTFIELLIVLTIIGLVLSFSFVYYSQARQKARDTKRKSDLKAIQQALQSYYSYAGYSLSGSSYPTNTTGYDGIIACTNPFRPNLNQFGGPFSCQFTDATRFVTFMALLPNDPIGSTPYYYLDPNANTANAGQSYILYAQLENTHDPDINIGSPSCPPLSTYNYCLTNP